MVKTSWRTLEPLFKGGSTQSLGIWGASHLHKNDYRPSFLLLFLMHPAGAGLLFHRVLGPDMPSAKDFSLHAKASEPGSSLPMLTGFCWEVCFAWASICGHLGYSSQGFTGFPPSCTPQVITAGCCLLAGWANPQELGSLGIVLVVQNLSGPLGHLPSCTDLSQKSWMKLR